MQVAQPNDSDASIGDGTEGLMVDLNTVLEGTMLADWVGVGRLIGFRIGPGCGVDETAK